MTVNGVIIQASARSAGNTGKVVDYVNRQIGFDVVDLNEKDVGHFDYDFKNSGDDFVPLMEHVIENHETIVFATPVYWYSMSGILKSFFDRFTDLLRKEKDLGRKLRGKNMAMISCGSDPNLPDWFKMPFVETAGYLGMNYLGDAHAWVDESGIPAEAAANLRVLAKKLRDKR